MDGLTEIAILGVIFFGASILKGIFGIGMPAVLIGFLTFFYDPRTALAMILVGLVASNMRQAMGKAQIVEILRAHSWFIFCAALAIFLAAYWGGRMPVTLLEILVGASMVLFSLTSLLKIVPPLNPAWKREAQIVAGTLSGFLGGISGIWGAPLGAYLLSLRLEKDLLIQTMGLIFFCQSLFLMAGFVISGELSQQSFVIGLLSLIPIFAGLLLGERLRAHLHNEAFIRGFLIMFLLLGLNLIRRGIIG